MRHWRGERIGGRQTYLDDFLPNFTRPSDDKGIMALCFEGLGNGHDKEEEDKEERGGGLCGVYTGVRRGQNSGFCCRKGERV